MPESRRRSRTPLALDQDPAAERPDVALADLGAGASILDEVELAELSVGLGAGSRGEGSC